MLKLATLIAAVVIGSLAAVSVADAGTNCTTQCYGYGNGRTCNTYCY
jgi:hypothetical protein